eukprot:m.20157 g.20157  ORF g.20157 m.20157 type:complete len:881 (+) comp6765_c0_seq1:274-2916(+)
MNSTEKENIGGIGHIEKMSAKPGTKLKKQGVLKMRNEGQSLLPKPAQKQRRNAGVETKKSEDKISTEESSVTTTTNAGAPKHLQSESRVKLGHQAPAPVPQNLTTKLQRDTDALIAFSNQRAIETIKEQKNIEDDSEVNAELAAGAALGRVKVFARVRPPTASSLASKGGYSYTLTSDEPTVLQVLEPTDRPGVAGKSFQFDHIFGPQTSNAEVFRVSCLPLVTSVMNGFNGTLMAYGQTGTGKTYTMGTMPPYSASQGFRTSTEEGMIPLLVKSLFTRIKKDNTQTYRVKVSYIQIYQDEVLDLLSTEAPAVVHHRGQIETKDKGLAVRESSTRGVYIDGMIEKEVNTPEKLLEILNQGRRKLVFGETRMNKASSRSHAICFISVECVVNGKEEQTQTDKSKNTTEKEEIKVRGKITLCDLAGSERIKKTGSEGDRKQEAQHINSSLHELGNVVQALATGAGTGYIPFRNSVLTRVLQESLGGNCKTSLIICCSPYMKDQGETRATCHFGSRAMKIVQHAKINMDLDYRYLANTLATQLELKEEMWKQLENKLRRNIAILEEQLEEKTSESVQGAQYQKKLQAKERELEQVKAEYEKKLASSYERAKAAAAETAKVMAKSRAARKTLTAEIDKKSKESNATTEALKLKVECLQEEIVVLSEEKQNISEKLLFLQDENEALTKDLQYSVARCDTLESNVEQQQKSSEDFKGEALEAQQKIVAQKQELTEMNEKLENEKDTLATELQSTKAELLELSDTKVLLDTVTGERNVLQDLNEKLSKAVEELKTEIQLNDDKAQKELTQMNTANTTLEKDLDAKNDEIDQLKEQIDQLARQLSSAQLAAEQAKVVSQDVGTQDMIECVSQHVQTSPERRRRWRLCR